MKTGWSQRLSGISVVFGHSCPTRAVETLVQFSLGAESYSLIPFSVTEVHSSAMSIWSHSLTEALTISGMEAQGPSSRWHLRKPIKMARGASCSYRDHVELTRILQGPAILLLSLCVHPRASWRLVPTHVEPTASHRTGGKHREVKSLAQECTA